MKAKIILSLLLFIFLFFSVAAIAQKIDPELIKILTSKSPTEVINVILISNQSLSSTDVQKLSKLNATVVRNFTLASWYEIQVPVGNVYQLQNLSFVQEIKPVKENKPLTNEISTSTSQNNLLVILVLIIMAVFAVITIVKKKKLMLLILFLMGLLVFIPFAFAQSKQLDTNEKVLISNENISFELKPIVEIKVLTTADIKIKANCSVLNISPTLISI